MPSPITTPGHDCHDALPSPQDLAVDAREARRALRRWESIGRGAARPAPSIRFEDYPREVRKRDIQIDWAAVRLASALSLHLD